MLDHFERWQQAGGTVISPRGIEVLKRLESHSDREIAAALGITKAGVRYHTSNIFKRLRVGKRGDSVRRAGDCPSR